MIKRTLYFGNPAFLSTTNEQMVIELPEAKDKDGNKIPGTGMKTTAPIEDLGVVVIDHRQITFTSALMAKLLANNTALITCDETHHPTGLLLNLDGNTLQSKIFQAQVEASEPLKKQLWQQTVAAKINNQAAVCGHYAKSNGYPHGLMFDAEPDKLLKRMSKDVKSGDTDNIEARAAAYYWKELSPTIIDATQAGEFYRDRTGPPPNHLLNYGYAILRAIVARNLVGSGLLPTLGIFHRNQYNAYCLADDVMEPYRPYVDKLVLDLLIEHREEANDIGNKKIKAKLLQIPVIDVVINEQKSPLMNAVQRTTASLAKCFDGKIRKLAYPEM